MEVEDREWGRLQSVSRLANTQVVGIGGLHECAAVMEPCLKLCGVITGDTALDG